MEEQLINEIILKRKEYESIKQKLLLIKAKVETYMKEKKQIEAEWGVQSEAELLKLQQDELSSARSIYNKLDEDCKVLAPILSQLESVIAL